MLQNLCFDYSTRHQFRVMKVQTYVAGWTGGRKFSCGWHLTCWWSGKTIKLQNVLWQVIGDGSFCCNDRVANCITLVSWNHELRFTSEHIISSGWYIWLFCNLVKPWNCTIYDNKIQVVRVPASVIWKSQIFGSNFSWEEICLVYATMLVRF